MSSQKLQREMERFAADHPRSKVMQAEAEKFMPGGSSRGTSYFDPFPFFVEKGEGHHLHDVDGHKYLDFMLNASTLITGHSDPLVTEALQQQASIGASYSNPTQAQINLARLLCERIPSMDSVRFANSGTEATLNVIRAARVFTGRHKIAKFEGGYHGTHEYASVSVYTPADQLDPDGPTSIPEFPAMPPNVLADVVVLPFNDLPACERILAAHSDELACVLMEPLNANFGYLPAKPEFLLGMRELTSELGILLAFDEVQSFRVASGGAQELFGVLPDLTALGKIVGGGLPVGAFGGRADIMVLYDPRGGHPQIGHAGTFNGNPMTMVAGEAVLKQLTPVVFERLAKLGDSLRAKLRSVYDEFDVDTQITGVASLFGVHFTSEEIVDNRSMVRGDQAMRALMFMGLLNEDVLMQSKGSGAVSTLTTDTEVDELVDATRRVVERVAA